MNWPRGSKPSKSRHCAAVVLAPQHISCYGLTLEEGAPLYARRESAGLPDDEAQAALYLQAVDVMRPCGYFQYEITTFARPAFESRHNLRYWTLQEYAGFGPGAHSDFGGVRYAYVRGLGSYISGRLILSEAGAAATLTRGFG